MGRPGNGPAGVCWDEANTGTSRYSGDGPIPFIFYGKTCWFLVPKIISLGDQDTAPAAPTRPHAQGPLRFGARLEKGCGLQIFLGPSVRSLSFIWMVHPKLSLSSFLGPWPNVCPCCRFRGVLPGAPRKQAAAVPVADECQDVGDRVYEVGIRGPLDQWVSLRENLQETIDVPMKYGISCNFSLKPIN